MPTYRTVQRQGGYDRWVANDREDKRASMIPAGCIDLWWNATIASYPAGASKERPVPRACNGLMADIVCNWLSGKASYDSAKITVPTILIVAEWDQDTKPYMLQTLFPLLTNAPQKRLVIAGEGTHTLMMEKNRMTLISEVQKFLEEDFTN